MRNILFFFFQIARNKSLIWPDLSELNCRRKNEFAAFRRVAMLSAKSIMPRHTRNSTRRETSNYDVERIGTSAAIRRLPTQFPKNRQHATSTCHDE